MDRTTNHGMNKARLATLVVIGALIIGLAYYALQASHLRGELAAAQAEADTFHTNEKVLDFSRLFVGSVLQATSTVDLDTRLKLENAVRDIKDDEILAEWNTFVNSGSETQAQTEVKNLLGLLLKKIQ